MCTMVAMAIEVPVYNVSYKPVALGDEQTAYIATPQVQTTGNVGDSRTTAIGSTATLPASSSFGSTSRLLNTENAQVGNTVNLLDNENAIATAYSDGFPENPKDPFLDPIGEVPFAIMVLLCCMFIFLRKRKQQA